MGKGSTRGKITTNGATEEEEALLVAAAYGDTSGLQQILSTHPEINLRVEDSLGRTPIQLAVANEQIQIVEILLDLCDLDDIFRALTNAIKREHQQLSQTIIKHEKYAQIEAALVSPGGLENLGILEDDEGLHLSALVLAAQRNQFEIVKSLLLKGQTIPKPHPVHCPCSVCFDAETKLDSYRRARLRLETYKALSSDSYLAMNYKDPFYTALQFSRDLKRLSKFEKHFKIDYLNLSDKVSNFLVDLLDHVDNNKELEILLNEPVPGRMDKGYARLKLALDYEEKKFVAHPSCQQLIASEFFGPAEKLVPSGRYRQQICMFFMTWVFILLYPILAIVYLLAPGSKIASYLRIPYFRFVAFLASTGAFLIFLLIFTSSVRATTDGQEMVAVKQGYEYFVNKTHISYKNFSIRTYGDLGVVFYLIMAWILGLLVQECQQLYQQGLVEYTHEFYNVIDFAMLALYIAAFSCYLTGSFKVLEAVGYFHAQKNWDKLIQGDASALQHMYWLYSDRSLWNWDDPYAIFEGLFALANALSFCRVSYILPASEKIGPLKITLGIIVYDVIRFGLIFIVIFMPFLVSLLNLYWYYNVETLMKTTVDVSMTRTQIVDGTIPASGAFAGYKETFKSLFWSLFGYGDSQWPELGEKYKNSYTETVGTFLYGGYHIILVVVLMNMLIAMMSKSFEDIAQDEDHEWKFARAALYMDFIRKGGTLAVPFNIIPPPKAFIMIPIELFRWCKTCRKRDQDEPPIKYENPVVELHGKTNGISSSSDEIMETNEAGEIQYTTHNSDKYLSVMRKIVDRYIGFTLQEDDKLGNSDDLKQDLMSIRFQMLNQYSEQSTVIKLLQENVIYLKSMMNENQVKVKELSARVGEIPEAISQLRLVAGKPRTREIGTQAPSWHRTPLNKHTLPPEKTQL
ncbi:short transient receptor potential channel 7-like isoform X2 [Tubulanus polymorphus]|uniref:short transient receptor potential channel 7-like isoform X2 n=1 Tax=Tubulanus polymorphus TaxID=672921 RepID=UPI003DA628B2